MAAGEFDLIRRFRSMLPDPPSDLVVGPGDDCAAVDVGDGRLWLWTCDAQVEGRHFPAGRIPGADLGRKTAAVNLSDIAAMGGAPRFALFSMVVPDRLQGEGPEGAGCLEELVGGVVEELERYGAALAGGNLSGGTELVADLTVIGEVSSKQVIRRSGARPGDRILVTGFPGFSAAGRALLESGIGEEEDPRFASLMRAHNLPVPRVGPGRVFAKSGRVTAMIDVSDGLLADLGHLCEASGVGADIRLPAIDPDGPLQAAGSFLGVNPVRWVASGGEDYELLLTCGQESVPALIDAVRERHDLPLAEIGVVAPAGSGIRCADFEGATVDPSARGWDHFGENGS